MNLFYYMSWKESDDFPIARPDEPVLGYELATQVSGDKLPLILKVKDFNCLLPDYLANSIAWPMMSSRLKDLISTNISKREGVSWVLIKIECGNEIYDYFIPKFNKVIDVLNREKTIFAVNDFIVKPHFSLLKIRDLNFFAVPGKQFTSRIIVSDRLMKQICKKRFNGMIFNKIASS